jgi:hypothetical protein
VIVAGFDTVATGSEATSVFATGDAGNADFAGTESAALTSLAALPPAVAVRAEGAVAVRAEGTVAVTAGAGAGAVVSTAGGFAEATDAAGDGQR